MSKNGNKTGFIGAKRIDKPLFLFYKTLLTICFLSKTKVAGGYEQSRYKRENNGKQYHVYDVNYKRVTT